MDKRRIRKYRQLQERIYRVEREHVQAMLDSVDESRDSEDTISALEESQCSLKEEIKEMKRLLDGPLDERHVPGDR
ncbi:MAG: hypothetical protein SPI65_04220 [Peptoniphilus sp.]|nr:hypothetical protein [Peptoniphilus sp.]MDD7363527.1 hypothetical protein [Bacillota bacterium]MDY6044770.1 hypothetical protein [Peptoniphilus sp.]